MSPHIFLKGDREEKKEGSLRRRTEVRKKELQ